MRAETALSVEGRRLAGDPAWRRWGPYLSERAWGTVREDYSADGGAWEYLPHDHARSRAYRWNEDGLGGICDQRQFLCFAFSFWNERDATLKERIFGLTGLEGNHGEDAKEYWWYLDSTPTHSWMVWRYLYPQAEFPYQALLEGSRSRSRAQPEYELVDTGVLDQRYWDITAAYAKNKPDDLLIKLTARNVNAQASTLHLLPTLWFRNTWSWGRDPRRPQIVARNAGVAATHDDLGTFILTGDREPNLLFCENESNSWRLWSQRGAPYPKDGINDHVITGSPTVNPDQVGTKAALWYRMTVPSGGTGEIRLRFRGQELEAEVDFDRVFDQRHEEADAFYASRAPHVVTADEAMVMRQAFAGMLWSKQFYHYDVEQWLDGDPGLPSPPSSRLLGRNSSWRHLNNANVLSVPDKWEYPWYAAWDLAFHCVTLSHIDPEFAKNQLLLLCREWFMHPNGQLPAYEWSFGDVNPPVHAWAALRVFEIDGSRDYEFLERIIHKLLLNFTWWVNRKDAAGRNVFEGGFLGLDNIGPVDRSAQLPGGGWLEQADGTSWMAMYCLSMLEMALVLARHDGTYEDIATKFFEHFAYIATAIHDQGLWDEEDGFYFDVLNLSEERIPLKVRSMVGLIPLYATTTMGKTTLEGLPDFAFRFRWFLENKQQYGDVVGHAHKTGMNEGRLLSIVSPERLERVLALMLDEKEFLSRFGLRSLSLRHEAEPFRIAIGGMQAEVAYEPRESMSGLFGGNSNWRGPIWFPLNYLVIEALRRFHRYFGNDLKVEMPSGSGRRMTLAEVAEKLAGRMVSIFLRDESGRRPVLNDYQFFQTDPVLSDLIPFHEYFHAETGAGLGASHQTGWTGLVADLICSRETQPQT